MNRPVREYERSLLISNISAVSRGKGCTIAAQTTDTGMQYLRILRSILWTQASRREIVWTFPSIG